jgi:hypothetical protein
MPSLEKTGSEYRTTLGELDGLGADASVLVGGTGSKFVPNLNANKWNDECFLNINHGDTVVSTETESFVDGSLDLIVGDFKHRYYITQDGRLEYEIHLAQKPQTNVLEFDLLFSEGLVFWKQPTLEQEYYDNPNCGFATLEDYLEKHYRPDNVINSYAVYWEKGKWNQYKTGKFCHIYRPLIIAKNDKWIWGELEIDAASNGLHITIDQDWLNKALFPIIIDPTFGYDTAGGSLGGLGQDELAGSSLDAPASSGTCTTYHVYGIQTAGHTKSKCGLYTDDSGPASKVGEERETTGLDWDVEEWHVIDMNAIAITKDVNYWIAANHENDINIGYDLPGGTNRYWDTHDYSVAWPATFSKDANSGALYSQYITYTEISALSINVHDTLSAAETIGPASPLAGISKYDTLTIQEVVSRLMPLIGNTQDQVTITELVSAIMALVGTAQDDVSISEVIESMMSDGKGSAYQDITVTEDISGKMSEAILSAAQQLQVSEDIDAVMDAQTGTISQLVNIAEYVSLFVAALNNISISELVNVLEDIQARMSGLIADKYDSIALTEVITLALIIQTTRFDTVQVSEYLVGRITDPSPGPSQLVEIAETIQSQMSALRADTYQDVTIQDIVSMLVQMAIKPSVYETLQVTEYLYGRMDGAGIDASQIVQIVEDIETRINLSLIDKSDTIEIAESIIARISGGILSAYDLINITDYPAARMTDAVANVFQGINISEVILAVSAIMGIDLVGMTFSLAERQEQFALTKRTETFSLAGRSMTFSLN